jgi:hypothetical protein
VNAGFRDFTLLLVRAIASLGQKTRFLGIQILSLGALPFLGSLAAYRGVDPGCHIFPPFLLPILIPLGNRTTK